MFNRLYQCAECLNPFKYKSLLPLSPIEQVCDYCNRHTSIYQFIDKSTQKVVPVRAGDVELATLRAWKINSNLTFKIPQGEDK